MLYRDFFRGIWFEEYKREGFRRLKEDLEKLNRIIHAIHQKKAGSNQKNIPINKKQSDQHRKEWTGLLNEILNDCNFFFYSKGESTIIRCSKIRI